MTKKVKGKRGSKPGVPRGEYNTGAPKQKDMVNVLVKMLPEDRDALTHRAGWRNLNHHVRSKILTREELRKYER